jgi:hypothetical protein
MSEMDVSDKAQRILQDAIGSPISVANMIVACGATVIVGREVGCLPHLPKIPHQHLARVCTT